MANDSKKTITTWLQEYGDELYSWALYKTSNKEIAEDLVQDTFVSACTNFDKFQNNSTPKTWLFSILKNKIIDHYRSKSRQFTTSYEDYVKPMQMSDDLFDSNEEWKEIAEVNAQNWLDNPEFITILSQCKNKLPENWQFILQARFILDQDSKNICQELEITMSNYWQIVHRAKLLLKKCIELNWI